MYTTEELHYTNFTVARQFYNDKPSLFLCIYEYLFLFYTAESSEDPYTLSAASASTTKSDDEEKPTPVRKKKSTSKKSKKNG